MPEHLPKWGDSNVTWNEANWTWSEFQLVQEILDGVSLTGVPGELALPSWLQEETFGLKKDDKDKRDRFVRLLCKVKGCPEYDENKKVREDIRVTTDNVALVVKTVTGIDIKTITKE